ncbi:MAG: BBP7 family outer membrane beta-barrel protein [Planctomycetia bacterium]|nr:BBP7 family outer membrane beta-barrel protein [Planctomycetia bacterium]
MQFRIRVPIIVGLLIACCHASALGQINSGWFPHHAPLPPIESCYDPRPILGCYRDMPPCWLGQTSFDVLLFDRSDADSLAIARRREMVDFGPPTGIVETLGTEVANITDFGFPVTAAFRFNLVLPGKNGCDLMFNYLGSRFDVSHAFNGATTGYPYFEIGTAPADDSVYQTSYESSLNSYEFNSRFRHWSRVAPLVGVRFMKLEDVLSQYTADALSYLDQTTADNQLWGFQLGAEALLWDGGSVRLQSTVKAGVFYNDLDLTTVGGDKVSTDPITMVTTSFDPDSSFSTGHISYFGEMNLELAYRVGLHWSIRVGYAAMWMDGVALVPDQFNNFNLQSGFGTFNYGTVLYHGSYVGFEATW